MPLASAADTPNLVNTLDKDKFVNAVSNNANTGNNTILSKEEIAKLQQWTQEKLGTTDSKELKIGDTSDEVKKMQELLTISGFYKGKIDGTFGKDTETAVKAFQHDFKGLKEDGQVGSVTLQAMIQYVNDMTVNAASSGSNDKSVSTSTKKTSSSSSKSTKSSSKGTRYYKSNGWGYINGMDCWAMSDYLAGKYRSMGYSNVVIRHAKTSYSNDHRWVEVNGQPVSDYSNLPGIYRPTR